MLLSLLDFFSLFFFVSFAKQRRFTLCIHFDSLTFKYRSYNFDNNDDDKPNEDIRKKKDEDTVAAPQLDKMCLVSIHVVAIATAAIAAAVASVVRFQI